MSTLQNDLQKIYDGVVALLDKADKANARLIVIRYKKLFDDMKLSNFRRDHKYAEAISDALSKTDICFTYGNWLFEPDYDSGRAMFHRIFTADEMKSINSKNIDLDQVEGVLMLAPAWDLSSES